MKRAIIGLLFGIFAFPLLARANSPPSPDIQGWILRDIDFIDLKSSDREGIYLGVSVIYENPDNKNEFVLVMKRFISFVSLRGQTLSRGGNPEIADSYREVENKRVLEEAQNEAEPFAYLRWHLSTDPRTGLDFLEDPLGDPIESWLLGSGGEWIYSFTDLILPVLLSEPAADNSEKLILVGKVFYLNGWYHVIKIDQDFLLSSGKKE